MTTINRTPSTSANPDLPVIGQGEDSPESAMLIKRDPGKLAAEKKAVQTQAQKRGENASAATTHEAVRDQSTEQSIGGTASGLKALMAAQQTDGVQKAEMQALVASLISAGSKQNTAAPTEGNAAALAAFTELRELMGKPQPELKLAEPFTRELLASFANQAPSFPASLTGPLLALSDVAMSLGQLSPNDKLTPDQINEVALAFNGALQKGGGAKDPKAPDLKALGARFEKFVKLTEIVRSSFFKMPEGKEALALKIPEGLKQLFEPAFPDLKAMLPELLKTDVQLTPMHMNKLEQKLPLQQMKQLFNTVRATDQGKLKAALQALKQGKDLTGIEPSVASVARQMVAGSYVQALQQRSDGISAEMGDAATGQANAGGGISILLNSSGEIDLANMDIDSLIQWVLMEGAKLQDDMLRDQIAEVQKNVNAKKAQRAKMSMMRETQAKLDSQMREEFATFQAVGDIAKDITFEQYKAWRQVGWGDGMTKDSGEWVGPTPSLAPPDLGNPPDIPEWMRLGKVDATGAATSAEGKIAAKFGMTQEQADMLAQMYEKSGAKKEGLSFERFLKERVQLKEANTIDDIIANNGAVKTFLGGLKAGEVGAVEAVKGAFDKQKVEQIRSKMEQAELLRLFAGISPSPPHKQDPAAGIALANLEEQIAEMVKGANLSDVERQFLKDWATKRPGNDIAYPDGSGSIKPFSQSMVELRDYALSVDEYMKALGGGFNWYNGNDSGDCPGTYSWEKVGWGPSGPYTQQTYHGRDAGDHRPFTMVPDLKGENYLPDSDSNADGALAGAAGGAAAGSALGPAGAAGGAVVGGVIGYFWDDSDAGAYQHVGQPAPGMVTGNPWGRPGHGDTWGGPPAPPAGMMDLFAQINAISADGSILHGKPLMAGDGGMFGKLADEIGQALTRSGSGHIDKLLGPDKKEEKKEPDPIITEQDLANWGSLQDGYNSKMGSLKGPKDKIDRDYLGFLQGRGVLKESPQEKQAREAKEEKQRQAMFDAFGSGTSNDPAMAYNHFGGMAEFDAALQSAKDQLDNLGDIGELESLRMQRMMESRQKLIEMMSNLMKKVAQTEDAIVQNMK